MEDNETSRERLVKKIARRMDLSELGASHFLEDAEAEGWLVNQDYQ